MNKRQKKKQYKKYIQSITKNWSSNIFFKTLSEQIMRGEVVDVGIRVKLPSPPKFYKARRLGDEQVETKNI